MDRPEDLLDYDEAARVVDRSRDTIRAWGSAVAQHLATVKEHGFLLYVLQQPLPGARRRGGICCKREFVRGPRSLPRVVPFHI